MSNNISNLNRLDIIHHPRLAKNAGQESKKGVNGMRVGFFKSVITRFV